MRELISARTATKLPLTFAENFTPQSVVSALLGLRGHLDRINEIMILFLRARNQTLRAKQQLELDAEIAWDQASQQQRSRRPQGAGNDWVAPRERYADASLSTLEQKRAAYQAGVIHSLVVEAFDVSKLINDSVDGSRRDLLAIIHGLRVESSLDR